LLEKEIFKKIDSPWNSMEKNINKNSFDFYGVSLKFNLDSTGPEVIDNKNLSK
jgi:hypothetical protein